MKKIILFICCISIALTMKAQTSFGVKAGLNYGKVDFSNSQYDISSVVGAHIGLLAHKHINNTIAVQLEAVYSMEGDKWSTSTTKGQVKESIIRVPLLLQVNASDKIFFEAGPQYSLLLSIKQKVNNGSYTDIKEFYKTGVPGYAVGAGYQLSRLPNVRASLRYNGDFSDLNDKPVGGTSIRNKLFQLSVSYTFPN